VNEIPERPAEFIDHLRLVVPTAERASTATLATQIRIDPRSTIASALQADLAQPVSTLTIEAVAASVVLAIGRLEACIFGQLEDPVVTE
jgi:hypothetical protein